MRLNLLARNAVAICSTAVGRVEEASAGAKKKRIIVAAAFSLGIHGLLVAFLLIGIAPNISGGGSGGTSFASGSGTGFSVELVSSAVRDALKIKKPDPENSEDGTDFIAIQVTPATTATTSFKVPDIQATVETSDASNAVDGAKMATAEPDASTGGVRQGGQSSGVNDALWKQIEPCWRRLAIHDTHGASLRVTFSALGNVAQTAIAPDTAIGSDAVSQAAAVEAISECGPYVSAGSRENVVIAFPAP